MNVSGSAASSSASPGRSLLVVSTLAIAVPGVILTVGLWRRPIQSALKQALEKLVDSSCGIGRRNKTTRTKEESRGVEEQPSNQRSVKTLGWSDEEVRGKIQSVLWFWFGRFPPDMAQKQLWMIPSSSTERRREVDAVIAKEFGNTMLELCTNNGWTVWTTSQFGYEGKLAAIVTLDQFSRHIHRHTYSDPIDGPKSKDQAVAGIGDSATRSMHEQKQLDSLAYRIAQLFLEEHAQQINCGMIPLPMVVFALMPFRHQNSIPELEKVQTVVEELESIDKQMGGLLGRFRKATNRRMAVLQDEARRTGEQNGRPKTSPERNGLDGQNENNDEFTDDDILEAVAFDADLAPSDCHPVVTVMNEFLDKNGIVSDPINNEKEVPSPVIVSLSGGVDSMVIAAVLSRMTRRNAKGRRRLLDVQAVHVDYANRPESKAEAAYVARYCQELGVTLHIRRIDEVTRGVTARNDYEKTSRDIRYNLYRYVVDTCRSRPTQFNLSGKIGIMLGHHRGDLRENVLSNAHKGCGPLDLSGMTPVSTNSGVLLLRPLLRLEKSDIYDYAHKFGVPYFKDTTPHWSTRGKLRNKLLPLLQEVYGEGSMQNLSSLAVESDEARSLVYSSVLDPFIDQVVHRPMGIMFHTSQWKSQPYIFWKLALREALHSARFGMFSEKSLKAFLERIQSKKLRQGWLQCKRDYAVYLRKDGKVYVLYPTAFPFRKIDEFDCVGCGK